MLVSLAGTLAGLEGRVIFRAFGQYIPLHPPWSYLAVTAALFGTAALAVLHLAGTLLITGRDLTGLEHCLLAWMTACIQACRCVSVGGAVLLSPAVATVPAVNSI